MLLTILMITLRLKSAGGGFGGVGGDLSPRLHPKSMDAVLGRYQVNNQVINR